MLSPLKVVLQAGAVDDYAATEGNTIRAWLARGLDGALISGALWRINIAHATLLPLLPTGSMGRITGAQPVAERSATSSNS